MDGVLLMGLVSDGNDNIAPQLANVTPFENQAIEQYGQMMGNIYLMLCAGVIHGDLYEFNVLVDDKGTVIIDFLSCQCGCK